MKPTKKIVLTNLIFLASTHFVAFAYITMPFRGWSQLENESPDIVLITSWNPTPPTPGVDVSGPKSDYQIEILSVLKGTNSVPSPSLLTDHELEKGGGYLVFGQYDGSVLRAFEDYRVIPISKKFSLESLKGKTLDEQLDLLFHSGLDEMNQKIQDDKDERDRLKLALQK